MTWKLLPGLARLVFDLALVWMLFGRAGKRGPAKLLSGGRIEFAPDRIGLWAYPLTIAYSVWLAVRALMQSHGNLSVFLSPAVFELIALSLLFSFPGTIIVTTEGLEQVYWLRKHKLIRWRDVEEIEINGKNSMFATIRVAGTDGTMIAHSYQLADQPRLLLEIQKHCGENLPPDFPREPLNAV
jgi:hypothetical protein